MKRVSVLLCNQNEGENCDGRLVLGRGGAWVLSIRISYQANWLSWAGKNDMTTAQVVQLIAFQDCFLADQHRERNKSKLFDARVKTVIWKIILVNSFLLNARLDVARNMLLDTFNYSVTIHWKTYQRAFTQLLGRRSKSAFFRRCKQCRGQFDCETTSWAQTIKNQVHGSNWSISP